MSAKQLPIYPTQLVGKLHHSLPQSIISDKQRFEAWFFSNYIQLFCNKGDRGSFPVNFYEYFLWDHPFPPLYAEKLTRGTIEMLGMDLFDFIVKCIDSGKYVYAYVDEFYVPFLTYQRWHYVHDIMIYGYDLETRELDAVGMTQANHFGTARITFEQFMEGYQAPTQHEYQHDIFLLHEKFNTTYEFDLVLVRELLEDYVYSRNTSTRYRMVANPLDCLFGMEIYDRYMDDLRLAKETGELISYLPIHTMMEHKECMLRRMEYMRDHGHVDAERVVPVMEAYREVTLATQVLRSMILKRHRTRKDNPTVDQLLDKVAVIRDKERQVLLDFLDILPDTQA
ncbi:hypothetical protein B5M42_011570 [Paenibacillus athensensis]|uniref:Butirosin biosynthesis protein H N-terminal domain-containing protein n=1 Tax=Paenibacillus athensensis TaxID=1967502 RepID=A0A4Y8Q5R6_9BACL|nr:hypothetical protein [Paenibacillus athensensis]MCD1259473.1 hypothetical protein [Paenibacillus athensensis]